MYLDVACRTDFSNWDSASGRATSELEERVSSEVSFLISFLQDMDVSVSKVAKMAVPEIEISFMVQVFD